MTSELTTRILTIAAQIGNPDRDAAQKARDRRWLDADGQPTSEGEEMLAAMGDQTGTRSAFRNV